MRNQLAVWLFVCVVAVSGCQTVRRATLSMLGLDTGFSLQRYDDKDVAVLPVITNPAFPLSPDDRDAIREAVIRNLRIVAQFHPKPRELLKEPQFPYTVDFQKQIGNDLRVPATIGISVSSYKVTSSGAISQLTATLSFVDSLDPRRHVIALQTYKSEAPAEPLNLRGPGFDWAVFLDISRLDSSLRYTNSVQAVNASADQVGPSVLAVVTPTVVSPRGGVAETASPASAPSTYRTPDESIPVRVLANDDAGLAEVKVMNLTTHDQSIAFAAPPNSKRVRYVDGSVNINLVVGTNFFQVSARNNSNISATRNFYVERLANAGVSAAFLAVAADKAINVPPLRELLDPMKTLTGENPGLLALLAGSAASYTEILAFATDIDQRMAAVHGISLIYFAGKISPTDKGLRLVPFDARYADVVSGMPLEGFVVSLAPRLAFFDFCANDPDEVFAPLREALLGKSTASAFVAPVIFSVHNCGQSFKVPVAEALKSASSTWGTLNCVPLKSLVDDLQARTDLHTIGSLDTSTADLCIARH